MNPATLLTGAASPLGATVARKLLDQGRRLVLVDRGPELLADTFPDLVADERHLLLPVDGTSESAMSEAVRRAIALAGRIHALVHVTHSAVERDEVHAISRHSWDTVFNAGAWSLVVAARVIVPYMSAFGGGRIVVVGPRAAATGIPQAGAYCASASALQQLVSTMALELRDRGIYVNSVTPSILDSACGWEAMQRMDSDRRASAESLANTVVFLATEASSAMCGHRLVGVPVRLAAARQAQQPL